MSRRPSPSAVLICAFLFACGGSDPTDPGNDNVITWTPESLVFTPTTAVNALDGDTIYARGAFTAGIKVENTNNVGPIQVTFSYEFTESGEGVTETASGVFETTGTVVDRSVVTGTETVSLVNNAQTTVDVDLGVPTELLSIHSDRQYLLTDIEVTGITLTNPDTLNAATQIRTVTNQAIDQVLAGGTTLGSAFSGVVLPPLVPGDLALQGGTATEEVGLGGTGESVWGFSRPAGASTPLVFGVTNNAPFTVPAGVPWAVIASTGSNEPSPLAAPVLSGTTGSSIPAGGTVQVTTAAFAFTEAQFYTVLVDTDNISRWFPQFGAGHPIRAHLIADDPDAMLARR